MKTLKITDEMISESNRSAIHLDSAFYTDQIIPWSLFFSKAQKEHPIDSWWDRGSIMVTEQLS